jgi:Tfp pilus assembly PilM family ATPase
MHVGPDPDPAGALEDVRAMLFGSLKSGGPPIAVDFGASCLKVLQISASEDGRPAAVLGAAMRATPPELLDTPGPRLEHQARALAEILKNGSFRGKRAVCSVSAMHMFVQHLQVAKAEGRQLEAGVHDELRLHTGREPSQFILRYQELCEVNRPGGKRTEVICLAMPREAALAHMKALRSCRLEPAGIHAEHMALSKGLERLVRPTGLDQGSILLIDLGAGTTKVAVSAKGVLSLAKVLPIGARQLYCPPPKDTNAESNAKKALRAQLQALEEGDSSVATLEAPAAAGPIAIVPGAAETLADEIAQCVRYHQALFPDRKIERAVFVGGEAARTDLCKQIARAIGVQAHVADPLNSLPKDPSAKFDGVDPSAPAPAWAVALGLCSLPTEA